MKVITRRLADIVKDKTTARVTLTSELQDALRFDLNIVANVLVSVVEDDFGKRTIVIEENINA